ncbi:MAG: hypothetical protein JSV22_06595 [Bacteroidales bacterium]|nr:MAG: hypothetical protein JSV22_06595 [Bacteroidales bacterium]
MKKIAIILNGILISVALFGQQFEEQKTEITEFDGLAVKVGSDFALQFQSLDHSSEIDTLYDLVSNFNLPTANLNINAFLADGLRLHLRTYLSSRHHVEAWVKGGYVKIDKLDFISEGFLTDIMDKISIKVGLDEINYGDGHFRRTDNARAINNPFVGNYIMDAFSTEAFGELTVQTNGFIGVLGISNGKLNQNVIVTSRYNHDNKLSFYGKLGYDNQLKDEVRVRLTGSWYINNGASTGSYLYGGDRSGSRYYSVLVRENEDDNFTSGRFNPRFSQLTAIQVNPFMKLFGLEFFGIYEMAMGGDNDDKGNFTQIAAELIYRFGRDEQFYGGGRYNIVTGKQTENTEKQNINRLNFGLGWFLTENVLAKVEYVRQTYTGDGWSGQLYQGAEFSGLMFEAAVSF